MWFSLKTVVEREARLQRGLKTGKVGPQLLVSLAVVPTQAYPDPARVIRGVPAAEGTAVPRRLRFVAHPAKCLIQRHRDGLDVCFTRRPAGHVDGLGAGDADDASAGKPRHRHDPPAWVGGCSSRDVEALLIF